MTRDLPGIKIWALTAEPPLHNSFERANALAHNELVASAFARFCGLAVLSLAPMPVP